MDEAEFRSQLDALGRKYQDHIRDMNSVDSPGFKKKHQALAQATVDEIAALEKKREVAKASPFTVLQDSVMIVEPPVVTRNVDPVIELRPDIHTWLAPDGSGDKLIELSDGKRFRRSGDQIRRLPEPTPLEPASPWIAYHDQLVKEWFDGERALIDDLYPDPPKKVEERIYRPFAPGEVRAAKIIGAFALGLIIMFISTLYLWA